MASPRAHHAGIVQWRSEHQLLRIYMGLFTAAGGGMISADHWLRQHAHHAARPPAAGTV